MSVKKIFILLITIVACVIIGALVLNVLLPNTMTSLVDATEDTIYSATKIKLNLNGNSHVGGNTSSSTTYNGSSRDNTNAAGSSGNGVGVNGFK